jgi:protein-tyrosine-phosphatase
MRSIDDGGFSLKSFIRPLVPQRFIKERDVFVRLGPAGPTYARLRILDALGIRQSTSRAVPPGTCSFLFVCYGNIMRSPMAEAMLKRAALDLGQEEIKVNSAGLHATPDTEAHPRAIIAARELGIPLDHHRSQMLTEQMVVEVEAILAMDFQNQAELLIKFPHARDKILLLSAYAERELRYREIPDPYFGDQEAARHCYAVLQTCINNLARSIWPAENWSASQQVADTGR